jgi:hypothetical protein
LAIARLAGEDWGKLSGRCKLQQACTYQTSKIGARTIQFLCRYQKGLDGPVCGSTDPTKYLCKPASPSGGSASAAHVLLSLSSDVPKPCTFKSTGAAVRMYATIFFVLGLWFGGRQPIFRNFSRLAHVSSRDIRVYPMWMARGREGLQS